MDKPMEVQKVEFKDYVEKLTMMFCPCEFMEFY